jgi:DNA-binding transcriptional MerR regulator
MEGFGVSKVPYFDIEDTIAEVGISRRQLGHWQDQGLLRPELGQGTNKYTVTDIRRLKALKHLIVERRLPISLVKELVEGGAEYGIHLTKLLLETAALFNEDGSSLKGKVYDFDEGELSGKYEFSNRLWTDFQAISREEVVERTLYDLTLLLFRIVRDRLRRPAAFAERRDEILRELSTLADVARVEVIAWTGQPEDTSYYLHPSLEEDEGLDDSWMKFQFLRRANRLSKFRNALERRRERGDERFSSYTSRFWLEEDLNAVARLGETASNDSPTVGAS